MATLKGPVLRDTNGVSHPDNWVAGSCYGGLFVDDGTGFVSAATPTAEIVDGSPVKVGRLNGVGAVAAERAASTDGRLNIEQAGDYMIRASGIWLSGNDSVLTIEVYKNGAVLADAAATPGGTIKAIDKMYGTAATLAWSISGIAAGCNIGDYFDLRVTGTVGTVTIKAMQFNVQLIADNSVPSVNP